MPRDRVGRFQLPEPEVEHLDPSFRRHHYISRLEVAKNNAPCVGSAYGIRQRNGDVEQTIERKATGRNQLAQRFLVDELHRQEATRSPLLPDGMEGDDVGAVERGDDLRLAGKPLPALGVGRLGRQNLHGDIAAETRIPGAVDLAHATGADQGLDAIQPQRGSRSRRGESAGMKTGDAPNDSASLMSREQRVDVGPQRRVIPAGFCEIRPARRGIPRQGGMKDLRHVSPTIWHHRGRSPLQGRVKPRVRGLPVALSGCHGDIDQSKVGFVHKGGQLQRVVAPLPT